MKKIITLILSLGISLPHMAFAAGGPSTLKLVGVNHKDVLLRRPDLDDRYCRKANYYALFSAGMVRVNFAESRKTLYTPVNGYEIFMKNYGWSNCEVWTRKPQKQQQKPQKDHCPEYQDWSFTMKRCIRKQVS